MPQFCLLCPKGKVKGVGVVGLFLFYFLLVQLELLHYLQIYNNYICLENMNINWRPALELLNWTFPRYSPVSEEFFSPFLSWEIWTAWSIEWNTDRSTSLDYLGITSVWKRTSMLPWCGSHLRNCSLFYGIFHLERCTLVVWKIIDPIYKFPYPVLCSIMKLTDSCNHFLIPF